LTGGGDEKENREAGNAPEVPEKSKGSGGIGRPKKRSEVEETVSRLMERPGSGESPDWKARRQKRRNA